MKLLKTDRGDGYARVEVENRDDLWHLKDLIAEGDRMRAVTQRTKSDGREKKTLKLTLEVEKTEYQDDRLRVTGEIRKGADDIELGYHTFNLEPGKEFELWKDFTDEEWSRLLEAEQKQSYQVLFCLIEKGKADFFLVEESGITDLSKLEENIPGKMYASDEKEGFFEEVRNVIDRSIGDVDYLVLGGPGFEKEKLKNMLSGETLEKTFVIDTSVTGKTGLHEAIKRGALERVVEDSRIGRETEVLEEFFERLEKEDRVSYGETVRDLVERGAVEKLIVTAEKNRENPGLAEKVEQKGGEVEVIHTDHEAGERLENFGGIAALLRYET
ncbi:MAG: mRNA surveillance protein pelota [Candidatus Nanohaloarchaea archaeon]